MNVPIFAYNVYLVTHRRSSELRQGLLMISQRTGSRLKPNLRGRLCFVRFLTDPFSGGVSALSIALLLSDLSEAFISYISTTCDLSSTSERQ